MANSHRMVWILLFVFLRGCVPPFSSGGGVLPNCPAEILRNKETTLTFEYSISGVAGNGAAKRFKNEKLFYRVGKDAAFKNALTKREVVNDKLLIVRATIPPLTETAGQLEYYLTEEFDGFQGSFGTKESPKSIPIRDGK